MKIALLNVYNTRDRSSWSGANYYFTRMLEKYCGEVFHLSPIPCSNELLVGRAINKSSRIFFRKKFRYLNCFLLSRKCAKVATKWLANQKFDVIVAPAGVTEVAFLKTNIPILLVEDATYKQLIDYYPEFSNLVKRSIYELNTMQYLALKKARAVIYSSAWGARSAIEDYGADPSKIHVVPFGANLDEVPLREVVVAREKSERCRLLFLGIDWIRKGGDIVFETLLKLEELGIQAELIVCGCTPPSGVVHERMKVIPFLDKNDERQRKELENLLLSSDFLLLPTRADCAPNVFREAAAFGLPAIGTNTGGVSEIIQDGETGFLLPYEARGSAYAQVIASVFRNDQRYAQLVRASRAAFEERLNWDVWGIAVKQILTECLGHKSLEKIASPV